MDNDDEQLLAQLRRSLTAPSAGPRQHDIDRLRERAALPPAAGALPSRTQRRPHIVAWAAVAAGLALAFVGGARLGDDGNDRAAGVAEFSSTLELDGSGIITVEGRKLGIGRTVAIRTSDLPILPVGDFYEVWFLAPGDTPDEPNRVSAGTFHPDEDGNTDVMLTAAVDPTKFPVIAITAEPADGDPASSGTEVARGTLVPV